MYEFGGKLEKIKSPGCVAHYVQYVSIHALLSIKKDKKACMIKITNI